MVTLCALLELLAPPPAAQEQLRQPAAGEVQLAGIEREEDIPLPARAS